MMKKSSYLLFVLGLTFVQSAMAKPSVYVGVNVPLPVVQQTTVTQTIQHLPASAGVIQQTTTTTRPTTTNSRPAEFNRFSMPKTADYRPAYRQDVVRTVPVVYTTPTVIYQTVPNNYGYSSYPQTVYTTTTPANTVIYSTTSNPVPQGSVNVSFQIGDSLPAQYRQINYWVNDWQSYQLTAPPTGHLWVNIGGRFMLVNQPNYVVVKIQ